MKCIDSEKLLAEIERRLKIVEPHKDTFESAAACRQELIWLKDFIDSLQQEQPEVDLEKEIEWEWVHREKQEVDLIECAEMDKDEFVRFARHFYKLGRLSNK